ncbi:developmentally regulated GTP binding protein 1 [Rhizoctonia solani AG-1 IA]|uniref:Developmentally regulated GTP binding protein 1 n=1 Tax=Thanatephorus cucumeris (strain AG1-IA) TaxID=983506 RepID=L8XAH6_THACA|nr:developmentally regulated GTP binding protein 1 [Rhizoctonia solani AG-1 IA]
MTTVQKIKEIEDEMPDWHRYSYHLGLLKAKLAKLRRELITPQGGGGGGGGGMGFDVARTGIASVGFVGFPSVGKSTLMSKLTGTHSEAAAYEFTTLTTVPGTLKVHGAPIQILDLPGIVEGAADGRGRGRQVIAVARTCNLIFIVLDVLKPLGDKKIIESELEGFGIRLNKKPPQIIVRKKDKGGIAITNTVPLTNLDHESIKAVLSEFRISNADVAIREPDATADDLIDVIEGNRYKIPNSVPVSSKEWMNIDELLDVMWSALDLVRVYTKPRGLAPDYNTPVVLRRGKSTVEDFCNSIHKEICKTFKRAKSGVGTRIGGRRYVHAGVAKLNITNGSVDVVTIVKKARRYIVSISECLVLGCLDHDGALPKVLEYPMAREARNCTRKCRRASLTDAALFIERYFQIDIMNTDHEIALMYASSPWSLFQPRSSFYSPFSNVVLRVVQPPRPSLEDLLLQFFTGDEVTTLPTKSERENEHVYQDGNKASPANDSTPNFDLSERMAREMQEQEDREQEMMDQAAAMRYQFGEYMSAFETSEPTIGGFDSLFRRELVNAEAGVRHIPNPLTGTSAYCVDSQSSFTQPIRATQFNTANYEPSELLDGLEAHLRHEINQFDFPEHLEFQPGNHTPVLLHTSNNAAVHSFEKALLDMRANLGRVEVGLDENAAERRSRIDGRIQRELNDLDRKVLETWAAKRRHSPAMGSRMVAVLCNERLETKRSLVFYHYNPLSSDPVVCHQSIRTVNAGTMNRPEQFTKIDLTPKRHHGYAVLLFIFGTFFPPLAVAARFGIGGDFWLNLLLTILGYFPGTSARDFEITTRHPNIRNNKNHRRTPKWAQKYGLIDDTEIKRRQKRSQWAHRYNERLPQSTLEGQEYEEGQNPTETPREEQSDPFRRPGEGALWGEEDENYYGRRPRANSTQSGSQTSLSNRSTRRWQYPANFDEANEVGGLDDGRKSKKKKGSSKRKDKKDRWGRTADAHAGLSYEDVDGGSKKKKKKRSKTTDDSMFSNRRSETSLSRRLSSTSEFEGPEDAVGGLYGERTALRNAPEPRRTVVISNESEKTPITPRGFSEWERSEGKGTSSLLFEDARRGVDRTRRHLLMSRLVGPAILRSNLKFFSTVAVGRRSDPMW